MFLSIQEASFSGALDSGSGDYRAGGDSGTQAWRWVIGQTGVIKCMLIHTFYDPCLSDHQRTPPSTEGS